MILECGDLSRLLNYIQRRMALRSPGHSALVYYNPGKSSTQVTVTALSTRCPAANEIEGDSHEPKSRGGVSRRGIRADHAR